ncbi:MAG: hypothetical protein AB4058_03245 [Microcystaceae cyanobacterium]
MFNCQNVMIFVRSIAYSLTSFVLYAIAVGWVLVLLTQPTKCGIEWWRSLITE